VRKSWLKENRPRIPDGSNVSAPEPNGSGARLDKRVDGDQPAAGGEVVDEGGDAVG
jgi:hypothetical protein